MTGVQTCALPILQGKMTAKSNGSENLKRMMAMKKGGVLLSSHMGNYGIASQLLMNYDGVINVLVFDIEHQQIRKTMDEATGGRTFNMIVIKDDMSHVYEIGEALARNEFVCMTSDRYMPGNRTITAKFFGEDALFPLGTFQIVKSFKAPYKIGRAHV